LARASACHAEGRGFESLHPLHRTRWKRRVFLIGEDALFYRSDASVRFWSGSIRRSVPWRRGRARRSRRRPRATRAVPRCGRARQARRLAHTARATACRWQGTGLPGARHAGSELLELAREVAEEAAAACWRSSSSMLSAWSASSKALRISRRSREACCLAPSPFRRPRERVESPRRSAWRLCSALLYCS